MFDDHVDHVARLRQMKSFGFLHAWFDDNSYWDGKDCYSLNQICADVPKGAKKLDYWSFRLSVEDGLGHKRYDQLHYKISLAEHAANFEWVRKNVDIIFEYPAVYDGCGWDPAGQLADSVRLSELG